MRASWIILLFIGVAAANLVAGPVWAQGFPPGSYQRSCNQIHWSGTTLVAECRRIDGRYTGTGLADATHCKGEIANIDGQLRCAGGTPAPAQSRNPEEPREYAPPAQGYGAGTGQGYGAGGGRGYGQGYGQGYGPGPGYHGDDERRARCEDLRHREHELRDRVAYTPWGPERDRLEYRLHEVHEDRDRLGCRG